MINESTGLPRKTLLLIALAQGLALLFLYRSVESGTWPSESPIWAFPLWTIAVAVPILFLLSLENATQRRTSLLIAAFGAVLAVLALYTGGQAEPQGEFPIHALIFVFAASIGLASFKALMYLQQRATRQAMSYEALFSYSWRNALTFALSVLFVVVYWLILMLWAELFRAIEVDFFHELFREDWFLFPVLAVSLGVAISIFRNLTPVIDSITRLLAGLIRLLLPLVIGVAVLFLLALPIVGLDALWSTGHGTALLLWLLAVVLFFTNAVYQDGRGEKPYPLFLHRCIYTGLVTLPLISLISFYGLWLRLDEYGWTVTRCWAFVVWLVLSLFAVGYVTGIARRRDAWTEDLARVNTGMGLVILALMMLVNSPLLDFRKISIASQLQRIESSEITLAEFDFWYAHNELARPGYLALEAMKVQVGDSDAELLEKITNPVPVAAGTTILSAGELWKNMSYRPVGFEVPEGVRQKIAMESFTLYFAAQPVMIRTDLDADGEHEYALIQIQNGYIYHAGIYYQENGNWLSVQLAHRMGQPTGSDPIEAIKNGEITLRKPRFATLMVGDVSFQVIEGDALLQPVAVSPDGVD